MCRMGQRRVMSTSTLPMEGVSRSARLRVGARAALQFLRNNPEVVSALAAGVGATACGVPIAYKIFNRNIARGHSIDLLEVAFCVGVAGLAGGAGGYLVRKAIQNWQWVGLGAACLTPFAAATAIGGSAAYIADHRRKKAKLEAVAAAQMADKRALEEKKHQEKEQAAAKQREMALAAVFDAGVLAGFTRNRRFNYESYDKRRNRSWNGNDQSP